MASRSDLISFWRRLPVNGVVHPDDADALSQPHQLDTEHVPGPWWGALATARAFLLYLNPSFNPGTDPEGGSDGQMASLRRRRLSGEASEVVEREVIECHRRCKSPFEKWFNSKLGGVCEIEAITKDLCVLNLVAYKSRDFKDRSLIDRLPSSQLIRQVVLDEIAPRARLGELMLVVVRQTRGWGFSNEKQSATLRVLDRSAARGGYVTVKTDHGQLLRDFLARV